MKIREFLKGKTGQSLIAGLLTLSLVLSLCLPGVLRGQEQLENPAQQEEIQQIRVLQMGGLESQNGSGSDANADAEGGGSGQSGGSIGTEGGSKPQENQEEQEQANPEEREENVETSPRPEKGPSLQDLSDTTIGGGPEGEEENDKEEDDGLQGEEGGEEVTLDLGAVLTWYKYGKEGKTVVCAPSGTVGKRILQDQLKHEELRYDFELTGDDAEEAEITSVLYGAGDGQLRSVPLRGTVPMAVPEGAAHRNFVFYVTAEGETLDSEGNPVKLEMEFTYLLSCETGTDLDLAMTWHKGSGSDSVITCHADSSVGRGVTSTELTENTFDYSLQLLGENARDAEIRSVEYKTASGGYGTLDTERGSLLMQVPEDTKTETYWITVTARVELRDEDGDRFKKDVTYEIVLTYEDQLDLKLNFSWSGGAPLICEMGKTASGTVKNNALVGGELNYTMELDGESKKLAQITAVSYTSEGGGSGTADFPRGSLYLTIPQGRSSAKYTFHVQAEITEGGVHRPVTFTVSLRYSHDLRMTMTYTVTENGGSRQRTLVCENKKSKTAETIYNDQLSGDTLSYVMALEGENLSGMTIQRVEHYSSVSGVMPALGAEASVVLQTDGDGTPDENTFTVYAKDAQGNEYVFKFSIPYQNRGANKIRITTNLHDGEQVTNGEEVLLHVNAWSEDAAGRRVEDIHPSGVHTSLVVSLDGAEISYNESKGCYVLIPENPKDGDRNEHTLTITARDSQGSEETLSLKLLGERTQKGQKIGEATILIDLSVIGEGVVGPISYDVLAEEPVSYVIAKAVWGYDGGKDFGLARETFGWLPGGYGGTLDSGFYLSSLDNGSLGSGAIALQRGDWTDYGSSEEEILAGIDAELGAGSPYAILWRCMYLNGVDKFPNAAGGSVGEFDFTSNSGWMYAIDGAAFYPGTSMSNYYLKDGDILVLRYTLAGGHEVSGGNAGYGDQGGGYCVTFQNGSATVNHNWVEFEGGYRCSCCGTVEGCKHEHKEWKDLGDGTCVEYCPDCGKNLSEPMPHDWEITESEDGRSHVMTCKRCKLEQTGLHEWEIEEQSDTATCTEPGTVTKRCRICGVERQEESPAKGHIPNEDEWKFDDHDHWRECKFCGQKDENTVSPHHFVFDPNASAEGEFVCKECGMIHSFDTCLDSLKEDLQLIYEDAEKKIYQCPYCGLELIVEGPFDDADPDPDPGEGEGGGPDVPTDPDIPTDPDPDPDLPTDPDEGGGDPGGGTEGGDPVPPEGEPDPPTEQLSLPEQTGKQLMEEMKRHNGDLEEEA